MVTVLWALTGVVAALALLGWWRAARGQRAARVSEADGSHATVAQKDAILSAVVDTTPVALVLFSEAGQIVFANAAARDLFFESRDVEGQNFLRMLTDAPEPLRQAVLSEGDELFTVRVEGEEQTFHVSKRDFALAGEPQTLVAVKSLSREIARQEILTLKKVIRIISHEINNSLGPISSLAASGRKIAQRPEHLPKLDTVFGTLEERAHHLQQFLAGYAQLARLPQPQLREVAWGPFLDSVRSLYPRIQVGEAPAQPGYFDPGQVQQVLINLIKNATEAGGADGEVRIELARPPQGGVRVAVLDRGSGMSDDVLGSALLPFFTTKPSGNGLGLALCREIVEQHRGNLRLARREGGGSVVSFWLPDRDGAAIEGARVRLTLTRG